MTTMKLKYPVPAMMVQVIKLPNSLLMKVILQILMEEREEITHVG